MKKIPTLFEREFKNHRVVAIKDVLTPGTEESFLHGDATIKVDGSCCAIIDGVFYKRYDAKKGKKPPAGAIPCSEPDPVTGHHPHWVHVSPDNPSDRWYLKALYNTPEVHDGTYEAIGKHFNGNPYGLYDDIMERHGVQKVNVERTFDGVRKYLEENNIEGLVFWLNGEPVCKIKRSDFGLPWPMR